MKAAPKTVDTLQAEIDRLQARLNEAESTLQAIHEGAVDGIVVQTAEGPRMFTLQGAETPYRMLVEAMNEGAATLSCEGSVLYANHRLAELTGRPLETLTGGSILDTCAPQERDRLEKSLAAAGAGATKAEFTFLRPDGTTMPVQLSVSPLDLPSVTGLSLVATDLTRQKRAAKSLRYINERLKDRVQRRTAELQDANTLLQSQTEELQVQAEELAATNEELRAQTDELQQSETRLKKARGEAETGRLRLEAVLEALPVGMAIIDDKGGNVDANGAFEQIWGQPRPPADSIHDYAAYKAWWVDTGKLVQPEEWASAQALRTGKSVVGQLVKIRRFDGGYAFVLNSAAPIRDAHNNVVGCAVAIQDVTALHNAQESLKQSEEHAKEQAHHLQVILDTAPAMIWTANDPQCRNISGNRAAYDFSRVSTGTDMSKSGPAAQNLVHYRIFRNGVELAPEEMPLQQVAASGQELRDCSIEFVFDNGNVRIGDGKRKPAV